MSSKQFCHILLNSETEKNRLICVVCGSIARGNNFGAITCMSCKMFFRRNALTSIDTFHCIQGGNCQMTPRTRRYCTHCRLLACFRMGMQQKLIRKDKRCSKSNVDINQQKMYPKFIRPLDLLQWSDRSQLSNNDWLLLRQLSSIFDSLTFHVISKAHEIYHQLPSIGIQPLKMRAKAPYIHDLGITFNNTALEFVKSIPQFILLPSLNKQALLIRNTRPMIMYYVHYQMNLKSMQNLIQTPYWTTSIDCLLLSSTKYLHNEINYLVADVSFSDPCLIKLILVILTFSTNNIDHNEIIFTHQSDEYYHAFILHKIQNIFVELMWKYMIYRFGEIHTILHFFGIIKTILRVQILVSTMDNSMISFEHKFYENVVKSINKTLQFNNNI